MSPDLGGSLEMTQLWPPHLFVQQVPGPHLTMSNFDRKYIFTKVLERHNVTPPALMLGLF